MTAYTISAGPYAAEVVATGAALRSLRHHDSLLTETWPITPEKPPLSSGLVLAPWPNRTAGGRYRFDGVDYQLDITEVPRNNANHGFVRRVDWQLVEHNPDRVTLATDVGEHPGWPFQLQISVRYQLHPSAGLSVVHSARNTGSRSAPYALGHHTFLRVGQTPTDELRLQVPAQGYVALDPTTAIPHGPVQSVAGTDLDFREPRPVRGLVVDNPVDRLDYRPDPDGDAERATARLIAPDGGATELWTDRNFGWLQVFVTDAFPDRGRAVAIEPMTSPPNALASGDDLLVLHPGQQWSGEFGIVYAPPPDA